MHFRPVPLASVAIAAAALTLAAVGCQAQAPPAVTSAWPVANSERTVRQPLEPVRWPFTGKKAKKASSVTRRPLSVKIENSSAARPQTGPGSADVVYETISEGGITRFNCIFHSTIPAQVGPVRSARLSDVWVVPQYDALFFFSGASNSVNARVRQAGLPNLSHDVVGSPYFRVYTRPAPHNLYMDTSAAYSAAKARGLKVTAEPEPLEFETRSSEASEPVREIVIPFSPANTVRWVLENDRYERYNNGRAHLDQGLDKQISADNVVVMWAKYQVASRDRVGSTTFDITLGGKGRVSVFRQGERIDGTWHAERGAPPRFKDGEGRPIKLAKGRTWFQVIPLDGRITMR